MPYDGGAAEGAEHAEEPGLPAPHAMASWRALARRKSGHNQNGAPHPVTEATSLARPPIVTVYGVDSCDDTTRALRHFDAAGLPYHYLNMDVDPAARALFTSAGYRATPVILTPAGQVHVEPSDEELAGIVTAVAHL